MPNTIKVLLWTILSLGMLIIVIMSSWIFLLLLGILIFVRLVYMRLFHKGSVTIHRYSMKSRPYEPQETNFSDQEPHSDSSYTTVIDADDLDKEYKIPKLK